MIISAERLKRRKAGTMVDIVRNSTGKKIRAKLTLSYKSKMLVTDNGTIYPVKERDGFHYEVAG